MVHSLPVKIRERLSRGVIDTLLQCRAAMFVTSLTRTAGHKMASIHGRVSREF